MIWKIFWVLLVLWLLGTVSSYALGAFFHLLLALAIVTVLMRVIRERRLVQRLSYGTKAER